MSAWQNYCSFLAVFLIVAASRGSEGRGGIPVCLSGISPVVGSHHSAAFHLMGEKRLVESINFYEILHLSVWHSTLPWMLLSSSCPSHFLLVCPGTSWQTGGVGSPVCPASLPCRRQCQRWQRLANFKLINYQILTSKPTYQQDRDHQEVSSQHTFVLLKIFLKVH